MLCTAPEVTNMRGAAMLPDQPALLSYGFLLDNVTSLLNWTRDSQDMFRLYCDPEFERFGDEPKMFRADGPYLTINVRF